ncbi:hypothetical protein [Candidatus Tisiphia endosymbiont of Sialis lutaria]|uniref:hypothetical protein n=1 Tax=Candidatus Tisiphia endosymbiont of Sialis lutaria TaxID=2029164 RepID=UPI00312CC181
MYKLSLVPLILSSFSLSVFIKSARLPNRVSNSFANGFTSFLGITEIISFQVIHNPQDSLQT